MSFKDLFNESRQSASSGLEEACKDRKVGSVMGYFAVISERKDIIEACRAMDLLEKEVRIGNYSIGPGKIMVLSVFPICGSSRSSVSRANQAVSLKRIRAAAQIVETYYRYNAPLSSALALTSGALPSDLCTAEMSNERGCIAVPFFMRSDKTSAFTLLLDLDSDRNISEEGRQGIVLYAVRKVCGDLRERSDKIVYTPPIY